MEFGDLLSDAWKQYKENFSSIFYIFFCFSMIPSLLVTIYSFNKIKQIGIESLVEMPVFNEFFLTLIVFIVGAMLISYFGIVSLAKASLEKKKFSFSEAIGYGGKLYWKSVWFAIVNAVFLVILFLVFIIPGIIFSVYWVLGYFIFLNDKKGVIESLRKSYRLVKNKWWITFAYLLLLLIIMGAISFIFSLPSFIMGLADILKGESLNTNTYLARQGVSWLFTQVSNLIIIPLSMFFVKNYYLWLNKDDKERNSHV